MLKYFKKSKSLSQESLSNKHKSFDDYDISLGDIIRGARATQGKSVTDVRLELRLNKSYITAIEHGDVSAFRTPKFVRGYVCSYAEYLGINPEEAFEIFCEETGFTYQFENNHNSLKLALRRLKCWFAFISIKLFWPIKLRIIS